MNGNYPRQKKEKKTRNIHAWGGNIPCCFSAGYLCLFTGIAAIKGINAPFSIDELLLAGKERMAFCTDADRGLGRRRKNFKLAAAGAADGAFLILGMDIRFHCTILSIETGIGYEPQ